LRKAHFLAPRGLLALGVVRVDDLAGSSGAGLGASEAGSSALSPHRSTTSGWGRSRSRLDGGDHGGGLAATSATASAAAAATASTSAGGTALPDSWAGHWESLATVVDGEVGVAVGCLVSARELDHRARGTGSSVLDLDLHARHVVLWLVDVGAVDTNVLDADEVLAVGSVLGDLGCDGVAAIVTPCGGGEVATVAHTLLEDLEPVAGAVVLLDGSRGLGHVDQARAWVLHLGTDSQLELDLVTGVDGQNLGLASRGKSALVATAIGAVDGGAVTEIGCRVGGELGRVVLGRAGRRADVLVAGLSDAVCESCRYEVSVCLTCT